MVVLTGLDPGCRRHLRVAADLTRPHSNRALTPREGARLQSFDDDFQFAGTRTQIVKQIGNAVPPLLGLSLAVPIADALLGQDAVVA